MQKNLDSNWRIRSSPYIPSVKVDYDINTYGDRFFYCSHLLAVQVLKVECSKIGCGAAYNVSLTLPTVP